MDDTRIKQRIIGAIVLVALGIIFIPMILSGGKENVFPMFGSPIPDKPDNLAKIKVVEFENKPQPPQPREEIVSPVDKHSNKDNAPLEPPVKPEESKPSRSEKTLTKKTTEPAPVPVKKDEVSATAFAVQVGSFVKQVNATALRDSLRKKGFTAFVEKSVTHNTTSYRVRVGPEVRREDAEKLQARIAQKMNIKGLVVKHP